MTEVTAKLNNYRQSPRKVRLVANVLRGKMVKTAKSQLEFVTKRATGPLHKLLNSAIANAKNLGMKTENLFVKSIRVDGGKILKRRRPMWRGMAFPINKRISHVEIVLIEKLESSKGTSKKLKQK